MKKYILYALIPFCMLFILSFFTSGRSEYYKKDNIPKLSTKLNDSDTTILVNSAIVRLYDKKHEFFCSGFVVSNNYIFTAAHCLTDKANTSIFVNDLVEASVAGYNARVDYGMLLGDFRSFYKLKVNTTKSLGRILTNMNGLACGYPEGQRELECIEIQIIGPRNNFYMAHGELHPGMSGGPLIVAADKNDVIGVGINSFSEMNRFIDLYDIVGFARLTGILGDFGIEPL